VGSVALAVVVGADLEAVAVFAEVAAGAAVAGAAAGAAAAGAAVGAALAAAVAGLAVVAFCTPPWPLQVPLPVEVVVVPSLQVVGAGSSAQLGRASANTINGAAIKPAIVVFFIGLTPF
jgi:hypothetical protein